jgi:hypothetical protein
MHSNFRQKKKTSEAQTPYDVVKLNTVCFQPPLSFEQTNRLVAVQHGLAI